MTTCVSCSFEAVAKMDDVYVCRNHNYYHYCSPSVQSELPKDCILDKNDTCVYTGKPKQTRQNMKNNIRCDVVNVNGRSETGPSTAVGIDIVKSKYVFRSVILDYITSSLAEAKRCNLSVLDENKKLLESNITRCYFLYLDSCRTIMSRCQGLETNINNEKELFNTICVAILEDKLVDQTEKMRLIKTIRESKVTRSVNRSLGKLITYDRVNMDYMPTLVKSRSGIRHKLGLYK
jgi:hypothetical protein